MEVQLGTQNYKQESVRNLPKYAWEYYKSFENLKMEL